MDNDYWSVEETELQQMRDTGAVALNDVSLRAQEAHVRTRKL